MTEVTKNDLMLAILSMSVYEEIPRQSIGDATYTGQKNGDAASGFFAVAYNYDGGTVISYRGTDGAYIGDAF
jgi:hypothetical protein